MKKKQKKKKFTLKKKKLKKHQIKCIIINIINLHNTPWDILLVLNNQPWAQILIYIPVPIEKSVNRLTIIIKCNLQVFKMPIINFNRKHLSQFNSNSNNNNNNNNNNNFCSNNNNHKSSHSPQPRLLKLYYSCNINNKHRHLAS